MSPEPLLIPLVNDFFAMEVVLVLRSFFKKKAHQMRRVRFRFRFRVRVRVRVIQMMFLLLCMAEPDNTTEKSAEKQPRGRALGLRALEVSMLAVRVRVTKGSAWRSLPSHAYCVRCDSHSRSSRGCSRTLHGLS